MTELTAKLSNLFDRHAKLVIDDWTYQHNPILKDVADRLFALAGLTANDVKKAGVEVYRTYAVITAFDRTEDGKRIIHRNRAGDAGEMDHRLIVVDLETGTVR
jgi:hypothetical protein